MRHRERQRMLFPINWPKPRPLPKLNHDQATALIREKWRLPDGTEIPESQADHWARVFLHCLSFEPGPSYLPPKPKKRPERPTAERLNSFLAVETDWVRE